MPKFMQDLNAWRHSSAFVALFSRTTQGSEDFEATRQQGGAPTQVMPSQEDYLADAPRDIGRRLGRDQWELFVDGQPDEALQRQFELLSPEFIALHDVGTASTQRLLKELAAAAHTRVQKLVIRRQGHGVPLAALAFVELPGSAGQPALRLYSTEIDADTQQRQRLARVLLARSRLGVVMVGDLPPHALTSALRPLHDAIIAGPWRNRQLLMLPLAAPGTLAHQAAQLGLGTGVTVRSTPQVTRPADAWAFISGAWNQMRAQLQAGAPPLPAALAAEAPRPDVSTVVPLPLRPMPPVSAVRHDMLQLQVTRYVQQCGELKGMLACCVFELHTEHTVAHAGAARPGPAALATQGAALFGAMSNAGLALGLSHVASVPEASITLDEHHLLLRALPHHPGQVLHAVLDRHTNLTLLRLQLQRLDALLVPAA
jgi:hypothetical protein